MEENKPLRTNEYRIQIVLKAKVSDSEIKEAVLEQNVIEEALQEYGTCSIVLQEVYTTDHVK